MVHDTRNKNTLLTKSTIRVWRVEERNNRFFARSMEMHTKSNQKKCKCCVCVGGEDELIVGFQKVF